MADGVMAMAAPPADEVPGNPREEDDDISYDANFVIPLDEKYTCAICRFPLR